MANSCYDCDGSAGIKYVRGGFEVSAFIRGQSNDRVDSAIRSTLTLPPFNDHILRFNNGFIYAFSLTFSYAIIKYNSSITVVRKRLKLRVRLFQDFRFMECFNALPPKQHTWITVLDSGLRHC